MDRINSRSSVGRRDHGGGANHSFESFGDDAQEQTIERIFEQIVDILVSQIEKEIGYVMQITVPEVLKASTKHLLFEPFSV